MRVGEMINQVLKLRKISQTELASKLSIPLSTLNGYVLGKYEPDYNRLREIADILDVTVNYLLEIDPVNVLSDDELSIILRYRCLNEQEKFTMLEYVKFLETQNIKRKISNTLNLS